MREIYREIEKEKKEEKERERMQTRRERETFVVMGLEALPNRCSRGINVSTILKTVLNSN